MSFGINPKSPPAMDAFVGLPVAGAVPPEYGGATTTRPVSLNLMSGDPMATKVTAVMVPYEPGDYDGHFVATKNAAAIADWSAFVQGYLKDGKPVLP
jgi:hypothetical protein